MKFTIADLANAWNESMKGFVIVNPVGASWDSDCFSHLVKALEKTISKPKKRKKKKA